MKKEKVYIYNSPRLQFYATVFMQDLCFVFSGIFFHRDAFNEVINNVSVVH